MTSMVGLVIESMFLKIGDATVGGLFAFTEEGRLCRPVVRSGLGGPSPFNASCKASPFKGDLTAT